MSTFREGYRACQEDMVRAASAAKAVIASGAPGEQMEGLFERELEFIMNERALRGEFDDVPQEVAA